MSSCNAQYTPPHAFKSSDVHSGYAHIVCPMTIPSTTTIFTGAVLSSDWSLSGTGLDVLLNCCAHSSQACPLATLIKPPSPKTWYAYFVTSSMARLSLTTKFIPDMDPINLIDS